VDDFLSVFEIPEAGETPATRLDPNSAMTDSQRKLIRGAFSRLEITDARSQFALIDSLMGVKITSVGDLTYQAANTLLPLLESRVESNGRPSTGNAWDDRTEDTWIDKL
jgi:hypothetical protein